MKSYLKILTFAAASIPLFAGTATAEKSAETAKNTTQISMSGSDLLAPIIEASVKSASKKSGVDIKMSMLGTYDAYDSLKKGRSDIAIIALPRNAKLPDGLVAFPIAYQAAVVIVNTVNPIEEISTKHLTDIFSMAAKTRAETWQQIGVKNIGLRNIMPIVTSLSDNVVVELFKYMAMNGTNIGQWVNIAEDKTAIYNMIKANNSAIAVIGKLSGENRTLIKAVSVSKTDENGTNGYAYPPTIDNIFNGDYPMTLPFYIVFPKDKKEKIKPLARILLSDYIAQKIDTSDFYSAPQGSRKKSVFDLDTL